MFSHHGPDRSPRQNRVLAAYLALNAGYVNSAGFVVLGVFTSHVTGNVGRIAEEAARGKSASAVESALLVLAFVVGGIWASSLLQSSFFRAAPFAYATALLNEALLLAGFVVWPALHHGAGFDLGAGLLLGLAMGMQNSLVTVISHARVRTTHLTGVTTDLSIELAAWLRWLRKKGTAHAPARPSPTTTWLLLTIIVAFLGGAVLGAQVTLRLGRTGMAAPAGAVLLASLYAFDSQRRNQRA